jgi:nucleoid-associated protein YgaU
VGTRYAAIYKANLKQIRNLNLIYPATFVVPTR